MSTEKNINPGETKEALETSPETGPEKPTTVEGAQEAIQKKAAESIAEINKTVIAHEELEGECIGKDQVPGIEKIDNERNMIQESGKKEIEKVTDPYQLELKKRENFLKSQRNADQEGSKNYDRYQEFKNNPAKHLIDLHQKDLEKEKEAIKTADNDEDRAMHERNITMLEKKIDLFSQNLDKPETEPTSDTEEVVETNEEKPESSQLLDEHEKLQAYINDQKNEGSDKKNWELVLDFLQVTKEDYDNDPTVKKRFDKLVNTESFQKIQESSYVKDNYEDFSIDEYLEKKAAITEAAETTEFINKVEEEFIDTEENSKDTFNSEYDLENLKPDDAEKVKSLVRNAEFNGVNDQKKLERMLDKGIISSQDVMAYLNSRKNKTNVSPFQSLASFPDTFIQKLEITDKLKDEAKKELEEPLNAKDTRSMSSIIFQKILAAETLHQSEQVQTFYKMINDTIKKLNDNQNLVTSFFASPNEKLFNNAKINQAELKKLFLKYIDECKQNKSALKQGHLTNLIKAKQSGYISDKEFKMVYPDKV